MTRMIGLLDMDFFYAQIEERDNPELKGKPVVVCVFSGRSVDAGSVATCNYLARELGIRSGMPIFRAKQLAREIPAAVFLPVRMDYYRGVSAAIHAIINRFTGGIETVGLDEAYFDLSEKTAGDWKKGESIALQIKKAIFDSQQLTCSVGLGPNKLIAKMACKAQKPDGLTIVRAEMAEKFLENLAVKKLHGIGPRTANALEDRGIRLVRELRLVEKERLVEWFGAARGAFLFGASRGLDDRPVETTRERKQITRIGTLSADASEIAALELHLQPLWMDVAAQLRQKNLLARTISVILVLRSLEIHSKSKTLASPTNDEDVLAQTARDLARRFLQSRPGVIIRRAGISASQFETPGERKAQKGLADFY